MQQPVRFTSSVLGPYDRGVELGDRFGDEIAATVAAYRRLFAARAGGPFDADLWAERAWTAIESLAPVHAEEIQGIADGSGRPVREIAAVNARTEILVAANPTMMTTECSSVVSAPPGRAPFAVQTWDWYHALSDSWFHWRIPHPDGRTVETVTEFGMLGKIGVNGYGVGVMLNMLHHRNDASRVEEGTIGYPVHLLSRRILDEARSFADAWEIVSAPASATSASTSLTVLDRVGDAATFELFPSGPGRLDPVDGMLVRTNHFISPEGESGCLAATISDSTTIRRRTLLRAFADAPPATPAAVVEVMTDHVAPEDGVGGVCVHPDQSLHPTLQTRTLATVSIDLGTDLASGHLDVRANGPCGHRDP
ncbi:MAG: peptidase C45 [Nocardioidaceae bacterium]|nr:peptidase C45 [Nocardioidaceae bacterium]